MLFAVYTLSTNPRSETRLRNKLVVPPHVNELLNLGKTAWITPLLITYKLSRKIKLDGLLKAIILPSAYKKQIKELDVEPA